MSPGNLWVGNLNGEVSDEVLEKAFAPFGALRSVKVMLDVHTGKTRGFGFVMFSDVRDASNAMKHLNGTHLKGSKICISVANNNGDRALMKSTKMCVRNVPKHIPVELILTHIQQFGKIVNFQFREDDLVPEDSSKLYLSHLVRVLVVWFQSTEEVDNAVRHLHNSRPWPEMSVPLLAKPVKSGSNKDKIDVTPASFVSEPVPVFMAPVYPPMMPNIVPQCIFITSVQPQILSTWPIPK